MKIFKSTIVFLFLVTSSIVFSQTSSHIKEIDDSKLTTFIHKAYNSAEANNILNDNVRLNQLREEIENIRIVKATKEHVAQFQKLSTISIKDYPYFKNFDPSNFNPLLFNFKVANSKSKSAFQVDGTEYYILKIDQKK